MTDLPDPEYRIYEHPRQPEWAIIEYGDICRVISRYCTHNRPGRPQTDLTEKGRVSDGGMLECVHSVHRWRLLDGTYAGSDPDTPPGLTFIDDGSDGA